ncbi:bucentaur or craniofacial development-domain-containing protein [Powellomyces hirtus]|nr:bucentaur or craniofacial development-domain-containing protein [Powellomyces hirtus]
MASNFANQDLDSSDDNDEDFIPDTRSQLDSEPDSDDELDSSDRLVPSKRKGSASLASTKAGKRINVGQDATNEDLGNLERQRHIDQIWAEMNEKRDGREVEAFTMRRVIFVTQRSTLAQPSDLQPVATKTTTTKGQRSLKGDQSSHESANPEAIGETSSVSRDEGRPPPPMMRKSNLLALAAKYGLADAAKLTVLEQSKVDWKRHVAAEGDEHTLQQARKDGYLEKVDFLKRTDDRQAELAKKLKRARSSRR